MRIFVDSVFSRDRSGELPKKNKDIKRTLKILWLTGVAIVSVIIAGMLAIQTPQVQTYLSRKLIEKFTATADARINFGKIHFRPFNTIILKDLEIIDRNPADSVARDTLFRADYLIARFSLKGLKEKEGIHIGRAYIRDAEMNLVIEKSRTNLERMFGIRKDRVKKDRQGNVFDIRRAMIDGMRFRLQNFRNEQHPAPEGGINWNDLDISDINIEARNIKLADREMEGTLDQLSFTEKSGYVCKSISGSTKVGHGKATISGLSISDPWSAIDIPEFTMGYSNAKDFKDFIRKIGITATVSESSLSMNTLAFFVPEVKDMPFTVDIPQAKIAGTVNNLDINKLKAGIRQHGIYLDIGGKVSGLPDTQHLKTDIRIDSIGFSTASIEKLLSEVSGGDVPEISKYAPGYGFKFRGTARGTLNSLNVDGALTSGLGTIVPKVKITGLADKGRDTEIRGSIRTRDLDIGKAAGTDIVHECDMVSELAATFGEEGPKLVIDSLAVTRLRLNNYDYSGIAAAGTVEKKSFNGKIICSDPNLNFLFQGLFTFSSKTQNALYNFYANIGYADLNAINIDKRGMSRISLQTNAKFTRIRDNDLLGNITVSNVTLENEGGKYSIGDIKVSSHSSDTLFRAKVESDFAEGTFIGTKPFSTFIQDAKDLTLKRQLPAIYKDSAYVWNGNRYDLSFNLYDTMDLFAFLAPGLYIAENTSMKLHIGKSGKMTGNIRSQRLAIREQFMKDFALDFSNDGNGLDGEIRSETINVATLSLKNNSFRIFAKDNHIGAGYTYDNQGELENRGEFYVLGDILRDEDDRLQCKVSLLPSTIYLNAREWNIMQSEMTVCGKNVDIAGMEFLSGEQSVRIHGGITDSGRDTLALDMERFDISIINPLLGKKAAFSGAVSGKALLVSDGKDKMLGSDFLCSSMGISGAQMGTVQFSGKWDNVSRKVGIDLKNSYSGARNLDIHGSYNLDDKYIDASALLDEFDISCMTPYLSSVFSETAGKLSGSFSVKGRPSAMEVESTGARFRDATLRIAFTNVPYTVNGGFHIDSRGIYFDDITLSDRFGNGGMVTGQISYENFRDIRFDTRINADRIECLNVDEKAGEAFYGNIFATAGIAITGPVNSMKMAIEATTTGQGQLHVPISSYTSSRSSDLLTFKTVQQEKILDPYEAMISRIQKKEKAKSNFEINLTVVTNPDMHAFIEIDKATGNVLSGYGNGTIDLDINPNKDIFNINGDYTLSGGNYKFVVIGLAKDFSINEGSSVKFNGDIMESTLDIDATYTTKTSLGTLISDTSSVSTRRIVECGIRITDKISNPRLQFSINVPDLDPTVKARVESALSTEDKIQKQFLSLLVSNSFMPDEQSGIVNNTSFLTSSVSEIMSNQLNNIFQKLDIPVDLGLSYQTNDRGNDIFDVAVSTQLFNNRVIVNGNIGNRQYSSGNTNNDVVGDLDIEVKIDRPGALRLNIFSHSADQYTNYLDNSQRNGVGLTYQQEFNSFKEFFKKMFSGRKKKDEMLRQEEKALMTEEKVVLKIKKDNGERPEK